MNRYVRSALAGIAVLSLIGSPAMARDVEHGKELARKCSVCHGKQGIARDPEVPNLAGQSSLYLEKSLKAFRSGEREDRRMTIIVRKLSDDDIRDLAEWFSTFVITVERP
jgi:cytochrome c553